MEQILSIPFFLRRKFLTKDGKKLTFIVGVPYTSEIYSGRFKCDYRIDYEDRSIVRTVEGYDGLHALFLSLFSIKNRLEQGDIVDPLTIKWEGGKEWGELGIEMPV